MLLKCFVIDFDWEGGHKRLYLHAENRSKATEDATNWFTGSFGSSPVPRNFTTSVA